MHRTLKAETTRPAAQTLPSQQERFETFLEYFNTKRPHQAIDDRVPSKLYRKSTRRCPKRLPHPRYSHHDFWCDVWRGGIVQLKTGHRFTLSSVFEGERIGLREVDEGLWLLTFVNLNLGHYDEKRRTFTPLSEVAEAEKKKTRKEDTR